MSICVELTSEADLDFKSYEFHYAHTSTHVHELKKYIATAIGAMIKLLEKCIY